MNQKLKQNEIFCASNFTTVMLLILPVIRFTVHMYLSQKIKKLFKCWVKVRLMGSLNHFQHCFSSVVLRVFATGGNNIVDV